MVYTSHRNCDFGDVYYCLHHISKFHGIPTCFPLPEVPRGLGFCGQIESETEQLIKLLVALQIAPLFDILQRVWYLLEAYDLLRVEVCIFLCCPKGHFLVLGIL